MLRQDTSTPSANGHQPWGDTLDTGLSENGATGAVDLLVRQVAAAPRPTISVVVPVRNRRAMLADTIDALAGQTLGSDQFEIIIADDASDDGTAKMAVARAQEMSHAFVVVRLRRRGGAGAARNAGIAVARGEYIAFTDSDCVPDRDWLRNCLRAFAPGVGIVQGPTSHHPEQTPRMFSHFIETKSFDGTFCTSNVAYRTEALREAGGFDATCDYWEDADLGWRVREHGWGAVFAPEAMTYHQVVPVSPLTWLMHARQFYRRPAIVARHRGYRQHLALRLWAEPWHALVEAALIGVAISRWRRTGWLLVLPYVVSFPFKRGLTGRSPALKVVAHMARDVVAVGALVAGSIRYRTPVL